MWRIGLEIVHYVLTDWYIPTVNLGSSRVFGCSRSTSESRWGRDSAAGGRSETQSAGGRLTHGHKASRRACGTAKPSDGGGDVGCLCRTQINTHCWGRLIGGGTVPVHLRLRVALALRRDDAMRFPRAARRPQSTQSRLAGVACTEGNKGTSASKFV